MKVFEGRPLPPVDVVMDPVVQKWMFILFGIGALLALVYAIAMSKKKRDILPLCLFAGGVLAYFNEAWGDSLALVWFPSIGQIVGYETFGHPIPLFHVLCYAFYFPPAMTWLVYKFQRGVSIRWLMTLFFLVAVSGGSFELLPIHYKAWLWYGDEVFKAFGYPLWAAFAAAGWFILPSILVFKALPYLPGWRRIGVIPLVPVGFAASLAAMGYVVQSALNAAKGRGLIAAGEIVSMALGVYLVWLSGKLLSEKPVQESDAERVDLFSEKLLKEKKAELANAAS